MSPGGDQAVADRPIGAFVSYCPADESWAAWIAYRLEVAGYRTLLQAWDLERGTSLVEFTQHAMQVAAVTIAVLSRAYLTYPQMASERQLALRADVGRLVTVRVEDCPPEGVRIGATHLDLSRVTDARMAEGMLSSRLRPVLAARGEPEGQRGALGPSAPTTAFARHQRDWASGAHFARRTPDVAPPYPPTVLAASQENTGVSILHVPGPRFGRGLLEPDEPTSPSKLLDRVHRHVSQLTDADVPAPDLVVVTGDLTETAHQQQMDAAWNFLTGLRVKLGLDAQRLIVVP
nr:TIR domain-containing protein [Pseudonocardiales bacterium]